METMDYRNVKKFADWLESLKELPPGVATACRLQSEDRKDNFPLEISLNSGFDEFARRAREEFQRRIRQSDEIATAIRFAYDGMRKDPDLIADVKICFSLFRGTKDA